MKQIKLIVNHGSFTIEVVGKNTSEIIELYQELLRKLEVLKREG